MVRKHNSSAIVLRFHEIEGDVATTRLALYVTVAVTSIAVLLIILIACCYARKAKGYIQSLKVKIFQLIHMSYTYAVEFLESHHPPGPPGPPGPPPPMRAARDKDLAKKVRTLRERIFPQNRAQKVKFTHPRDGHAIPPPTEAVKTLGRQVLGIAGYPRPQGAKLPFSDQTDRSPSVKTPLQLRPMEKVFQTAPPRSVEALVKFQRRQEDVQAQKDLDVLLADLDWPEGENDYEKVGGAFVTTARATPAIISGPVPDGPSNPIKKKHGLSKPVWAGSDTALVPSPDPGPRAPKPNVPLKKEKSLVVPRSEFLTPEALGHASSPPSAPPLEPFQPLPQFSPPPPPARHPQDPRYPDERGHNDPQSPRIRRGKSESEWLEK